MSMIGGPVDGRATGAPAGYGTRAPTSARLRHDAYHAQLAHRKLDHEWPEEA